MKTAAIAILALAAASPLAASLPAQTPGGQNSPLKLHEWVAPFFPPRLFSEGIVNGEVRVAIQVVAYTDPSLVGPTLDALRKWTFDPALVNGEARGTTTGLVFSFQPDGPVIVQGNAIIIQSDRNWERKFAYEVRELSDLDSIPAPVHIVKPAPVVRLDKSGGPVEVTVDFYIDETGRVRMPAVGRSQDNPLAWAAVQAVSQWRFAPPTVGGKPVTVHAEQVFEFKP